MGRIEIIHGKKLRLDNVLIRKIINTNLFDEDETSIGLELRKMENEIRIKGSIPVGPLIQLDSIYTSDKEMRASKSFLLQADHFFDAKLPYEMQSSILVENCLYTHFDGQEDDIIYAYQKMQIIAYEENLNMTGRIFTIYLSDDDIGNITADIFMEIDS